MKRHLSQFVLLAGLLTGGCDQSPRFSTDPQIVDSTDPHLSTTDAKRSVRLEYYSLANHKSAGFIGLPMMFDGSFVEPRSCPSSIAVVANVFMPRSVRELEVVLLQKTENGFLRNLTHLVSSTACFNESCHIKFLRRLENGSRYRLMIKNSELVERASRSNLQIDFATNIADIDANGVVTPADRAYIRSEIGHAATENSVAEVSDINCDGVVNAGDLGFYSANMGNRISP